MLIQCPACGTRANLPDSKEGAKVRCGECGRVYVARPAGASRSSGGSNSDPTRYVIMGGAALLCVGALLWYRSIPDEPVAAEVVEEVEEEAPPKVDMTSWDSPLVMVTRNLHDAVHAKDKVKIQELLDGRRIYARLNEAPPENPDEVRPLEPLGPRPLAEGTEDWLVLSKLDQQRVVESAIDDLTGGEGFDLVGTWRPWDGSVIVQGDKYAVIRVKVANRDDQQAADRNVEWRLVREGTKWRAWSWERWISPEEAKGERRARSKKTTKRTLSDGSEVIEATIRDLGHLDDTPQELQDEIDALLVNLVDIDARPKVRSTARDRLYEIGRPAVPPLLSMIHKIPLETDDQAIQLQQVHMLLTDMTGYQTTFKPHVALGATEERIDSGLKQWFGWYERKWRRYQGPEQAEAEWDLEGWEPRNERERREIEKAQAELEAKSGGR